MNTLIPIYQISLNKCLGACFGNKGALGAPNGGLVLYQGEMGCLLCSCADSPVESEGGQEGGLFEGSLIRGRL